MTKLFFSIFLSLLKMASEMLLITQMAKNN